MTSSEAAGLRIVGYAFAICSAVWLAFFFNYGMAGQLGWAVFDAVCAYALLRVR